MGRESVGGGHGPRGARGHFAVPVVDVAVPEHAVGSRYADLRIDHLEAVDDFWVVGGLDPKAYQLRKPASATARWSMLLGPPLPRP
jgi:hypothetical protein